MAIVNEATKKEMLSETCLGEHNMLVYRDLYALREMYCTYCKARLETASEIVLIATQYETPGKVKQNLIDAGIDAKKYENNGSLVIVDAVKGYHRGDVKGVLKLAKSLAIRAKKEGRQRGVCVFGDPGSFFMFNKLAELLQYELSLPHRFDVKINAFCSYHEADFDRLTSIQKQALEDGHHRKITA